jgi:GMP synthase-like glutamine amidotransferase
MFLDLLADQNQVWEVYDAEHGKLPDRPDLYAGFVITGSPSSAYDDVPWIRALQELARASHRNGQALLGICFGHQVIAQALGGTVKPNPRGWDIGVRQVSWIIESTRILPTVHLPSTVPKPLRIFELHRDAVTRLPPMAQHLAGSEHTKYEAFCVGARTLGLQGHPEFDAVGIREAVERLTRAGILCSEQARQHLATLVDEPQFDFLRLWLRTFLRAATDTTISVTGHPASLMRAP